MKYDNDTYDSCKPCVKAVRAEDHGSKGQRRARPRHGTSFSRLSWLLLSSSFLVPGQAIHHMQRDPVQLANRDNSDRPLIVTSYCDETIYPAILTQAGDGPEKSGFRLNAGESVSQIVSANWQGRVWGRTNCSFAEDGTVPSSGQGGAVCSSGDCGAFMECQGAGNPPATLAEFTMSPTDKKIYYDLSLVDGYNLPVGLIFRAGNNTDPQLAEIPPNLTNAICIASSQFITDASTANDTLGSNETYPIPLDRSLSVESVRQWCPWPLQLNPPVKPGDGVYPYPDDNIQRPFFNPCFSACSKFNEDKYCCSGSYDNPNKCKPSYYSLQAKKMCPDAYSYAYDDQTSTFTMPEGGGFEVVFCPSGRSSNILKTFGNQISEVAVTGKITPEIESLARNQTYIKLKSDGTSLEGKTSIVALVVVIAIVCFW